MTDSIEAKILVVDDELPIREILVEGLEVAGHSVQPAPNADTAFERVQSGEFDLVLSDIDMPGRSGVDLLKQIKEFDRDLDVIMVTGVVDTSVAIGTIRDGASDYVTKPFNLAEVQLVVERTLEKRRLINENRRYQNHLEELVEERTQKLRATYESTLRALVTALDFRDNETQGHSTRVVEYATVVARTMGLPEEDLTVIRRGAILHDVGKIGTPDAILCKPDKLNDEEWIEMKKHPAMGYHMLKNIEFIGESLKIVLHHHERFDGQGYPAGLSGEEIPLGARIFAVVDTFDAMTSDRPYRKALPIKVAYEEIERFKGEQFDPVVADAFLSIDPGTWKSIRERVHQEITSDLHDMIRIVSDAPS